MGVSMNRFEQDKAEKLHRIIPLRIMSTLGMIAWREDRYGCADQRLRILHPLTWPYVLCVLVVAVVAHGVIEVVKEAKNLRDELVWW